MLIERFRKWYEHEKFTNQLMLNMLNSVPTERRGEPEFAKAVNLAAHLALCRENWLNRMDGDGTEVDHWFETDVDLESLPQRFANIERSWTLYLHRLSDADMPNEFSFNVTETDEPFSLPIEVQLTQMVGHAFYHRGQIVQIVDNLGGETVDTDYLFWAVHRN
jgi:uncharacterized damage-inducible protein DinB